MKLSIKAMAAGIGLLWGGCLFFVGLINLVDPAYGTVFLQTMSSVYPGFHATHTLRDVVIGGLDGLVDGAVAGMLFAVLYNFFRRRRGASIQPVLSPTAPEFWR